jgi:hypothetical protein
MVRGTPKNARRIGRALSAELPAYFNAGSRAPGTRLRNAPPRPMDGKAATPQPFI